MELLGLYNEKREQVSKINRKDKEKIEKPWKFAIILAFIINDKNEFLIQKCVKEKGGLFAITGGHVVYGDTFLETAIKEVNEELGIKIEEQNCKLFKEYEFDKAYLNVYLIRQNIKLEDITIQKEEVDSVHYMNLQKIEELIENEEFRKSNIKPLKDIVETIF